MKKYLLAFGIATVAMNAQAYQATAILTCTSSNGLEVRVLADLEKGEGLTTVAVKKNGQLIYIDFLDNGLQNPLKLSRDGSLSLVVNEQSGEAAFVSSNKDGVQKYDAICNTAL